jgi:hypothetical protein
MIPIRLGRGSLVVGFGILLLQGAGPVAAQSIAPPGGDYQKASELVGLPDFVPGLGTLYVQPKTLPAGPYLAYDRQGHLVSSVYMIPLKDIAAHQKVNFTGVPDMVVDHVDLRYSAGHPGVPDPHYHVILWYIRPAEANTLK